MDSKKDSNIPETYIPATRDADSYNMNHKNRGMAVIFNHEKFRDLPKRHGAAKDVKELEGAFGHLGFQVIPYKDSTRNQVLDRAKQAADFDHTDSDCIVICILTHGDVSGYVQARDGPYCLDMIFKLFTADRCPTLAGKPKLFFIQACRGKRLDEGFEVKRKVVVRDGPKATSNNERYRIPLNADFLMAYSTIPDFASWRSPVNGSWFIQALARELNENGKVHDIFSLLTLVNRRLAIEFESYCPDDPQMDYKKQISCFTSMLTRLLRF